MEDREARRVHDVTQALERLAGVGEVRVVRSPLRVCPLGAHVDHQHGIVTGLTLDAAVLLAFRPRADSLVRLWSLDFPGEVAFDLQAIGPAQPGDWGNYPRGAAWVMRERCGLDRGLDGVISGPLPVGGLSSSAAVDVAYLLALQEVAGCSIERLEHIRLAQRIENEYIGLNNGILDQSIVLQSRRGSLTWLDCRDTRFDHIPSPPDQRFDLVVVYSGLSRALVGTGYNQRVDECAAAARWLLDRAGQPSQEPPRLRQVPAEVFETYEAEMPAVLARRARHFFTEQSRVAAGVGAWRQGDLAAVGQLMGASGASSISNYECGSPHLITLYELLNEIRGVHGARFSGAGFRGSCVALAEPGARERIVAELACRYPAAHPDVAASYSVHFCAPAGPAELL